MIAKCLVRQKTQKNYAFDYLIPENLKVELFSLVEVPFLNKKIEAIVIDTHKKSKFANKQIIRVLSNGPIITRAQDNLANKISHDFFADKGSTIFAFLPQLNKKDLARVGFRSNTRINTNSSKPTILVADYDYRQSYYLESLSKKKQNLLIFPEIKNLELFKKKILSIDPSRNISVWHSLISQSQKAFVWQKLLEGEPLTIISSRHGLFLPFTNLEKIIVEDVENFGYFEDQEPRYNVKQSIKSTAEVYGAKLILGSSFPSLESFAWIKSNKATLVFHRSRLKFAQVPSIKNIFSDEGFAHSYKKAKKILVTGFFSNDSDQICQDCNRIIKSTTKLVVCPNCQSPKTRLKLINKKQIQKITQAIFNNDVSISPDTSAKIVIGSLSEISNFPKSFDLVIVPYLDLFASYPFLNFKLKIIKSLLDLGQVGAREIYLCSSSDLPLSKALEDFSFESYIYQELASRKAENLPPFSRVLELKGSQKDLVKIKDIIDDEQWICQEHNRYFALLNKDQLDSLRSYYAKKKLNLHLRLDPPEFSA